MDDRFELVGQITGIERSTTGYGENERTIGVRVTAKVDMADSLGTFQKDLQFTIPQTDLFRPYVGDVIHVMIYRPDQGEDVVESIEVEVPVQPEELSQEIAQKYGDETALADPADDEEQ